MYKVRRETINGLNGIQPNVTENGILKQFPSRDLAQNYLRELISKADVNRFRLKGISKNEFYAYFKPETLHYFRFYVSGR